MVVSVDVEVLVKLFLFLSGEESDVGASPVMS